MLTYEFITANYSLKGLRELFSWPQEHQIHSYFYEDLEGFHFFLDFMLPVFYVKILEFARVHPILFIEAFYFFIF